MSILKIEIDTQNDAFNADPMQEIERLLIDVIRKLGQHEPTRTLRDLNGNTVGSFSYGP